jgi:hypothetical protein
MRKISPAVIVHGLKDARRALEPRLPVTLLSAPGAALYAGCLWWQKLLEQVEFKGTALLDCADAPGRALEALKLGLGGIVLNCPQASFAVVAEIAAAQGAFLLSQAPPALDLGQCGANRRLEAWLTG